MYFILTFFVALLSIVLPLWIFRRIVIKWHVHPKIFWRAGLAGLVCSLFIAGIVFNIDSAFPQFSQISPVLQALVLGLVTGLFMELGKFLILDRMMPYVRSAQATTLFGVGWSGFGIIIAGIFLAIGVFGMNTLVNTKDLSSALPNLDQSQIQILQQNQQVLQQLTTTPWKAIDPLLENTANLIMDIALSFLIVFGITRRESRYTWAAVGIRSLLAALLFYFVQIDSFPVELIYLLWIAVSLLLCSIFFKKLKSAV